nr:palmitoyltransferase ZDHHC7-like [Lytechinus pictus]
MVTCRDDPCGFVCIIITYCAVIYADYVVVNWLIIPSSMSSSLWGAVHALIFNCIVLCLTVAHLRAVLSDPGIVPLPTTAIDFSDVRTGQAPKSRVDRVSGQSWTVCQKCEAYRPPRAHHCRICRRCIRKMDHHCPWINNCVGEFNQKYFIQFLFYVGEFRPIFTIILLILTFSPFPLSHLPKARRMIPRVRAALEDIFCAWEFQLRLSVMVTTRFLQKGAA